MTWPLRLLAAGAIVAGLVGIPAALFGPGPAIEHFLEPSLRGAAHTRSYNMASETTAEPHASPGGRGVTGTEAGPTGAGTEAGPAGAAVAEGHMPAPVTEHGSTPTAAGQASLPVDAHAAVAEAAHEDHHNPAVELGLMAFSVLIALGGIGLAYHLYVRQPETSESLARSLAGPHRVLTHKYYVDEVYNATAVRGTIGSARGLWVFDARVVDGAVNGSGWLTRVSAWVSHMVDKYIVDGAVNLVGAVAQEGSFVFRRAQTGLIQNYALLMLIGVFGLVTWYLIRVFI
jgi:NADH-quinone oxidoreductase subunit L